MASFKKLQVLEFSDSLYRGLKELVDDLNSIYLTILHSWTSILISAVIS